MLIFLICHLKHKQENKNKCDYIKLKDFWTAKEMFNKMKRQSKEWEKIFANHMSNEKLISKYMRDSYNSIAENKQKPIIK